MTSTQYLGLNSTIYFAASWASETLIGQVTCLALGISFVVAMAIKPKSGEQT